MVRRRRHGKYTGKHKVQVEHHHSVPAQPASYSWYYSSSRVRSNSDYAGQTVHRPRSNHARPSRTKVVAVIFAWLVGLSLLGLVLLGTFTSGGKIISDIKGTFSGSTT